MRCTLFFLATRHLLGTIVAGMALFTAFRLFL
jgi:branched-subunit amino acid transport protein